MPSKFQFYTQMADHTAKQVTSDYYIHIPKKIIHVTNSENMIPHLMGMQYIGRPDMFTGDRGAYMIKKQRLKYDSLEKLVQKYYRGKSKQDLSTKFSYGVFKRW